MELIRCVYGIKDKSQPRWMLNSTCSMRIKNKNQINEA